MKKRKILASIGITALSLGIYSNQSYAYELGTVTASALNVRSGPSIENARITKVYNRDKVEILSSSNGWYNIKLNNGKKGWASSKYIKKGSSNQSYAHEVGTVTASALNVRSGAGIENARITKVYKGDKVEILSSSNGWYNIQLNNGKKGWVSSKYIKKGSYSNNDAQVSQGKAKVKVTSLNVRKGPSTSYNKIGLLSNGQVIDILEKSGAWSKIKTSNGLVGWVASTYLTSDIRNINENVEVPSIGVGREAIVELAYKQLDKKYVWGAEGPNSFDCSGLTGYVYKNAIGKSIPRTSRAQSQYGQYVSKSELQPGDLVFSDTDNNGSVNHVGIYIGNGKMIHAPKPGDVVKISDINNSFYKKAYVTSRRP